MNRDFDRRNFLRVSGMSLCIGALISIAPSMAGAGTAAGVRRWFRSRDLRAGYSSAFRGTRPASADALAHELGAMGLRLSQRARR
jgi:hypothetical protein